MVPVILETPSGSRAIIDALVDSGSDRTLFPAAVAAALGIDLTTIPPALVVTALGVRRSYHPVELFLELRRRPDAHRWRCTVGFLSHPTPHGYLGTDGFFKFFSFYYNARAGILDIDPSGPLPQ
jgi:hypothetical protein